MEIFIPQDLNIQVDKKELFLLTRPFYDDGKWVNDSTLMERWRVPTSDFQLVTDAAVASFMLLPYSINTYVATANIPALEKYSDLCRKYDITSYGYVSGDWGLAFPEFENCVYFRMGGFRSQLSDRNHGFPVALSDHHARLYGSERIEVRRKQESPVVGFCGHASYGQLKRIKESAKFVIENGKRLMNKPIRNDWEPIFPSAYHRAKLLRNLEGSSLVDANFIYREHYRGGAISNLERETTTREYYDNIRSSDYVLCIRGGGNFSVRLYETLMMGRIPVFLNTDCLLPFPEKIGWKHHVVWVEWEDRENLAEAISRFHEALTDEDFLELQQRNRLLWSEQLSVSGMLKMLT